MLQLAVLAPLNRPHEMLHDQLKHFIMGDLLALDVYRWYRYTEDQLPRLY